MDKNVKVVLNVLIINLLCLLLSNPTFAQLTRDQMLNNAHQYWFLTWLPNTNCVEQFETAEDISNSSSSQRKNDFYDDAYDGIWRSAMCYAWGSWNTTNDFTNKIALGTAENTEALDFSNDSRSGSHTYEIQMSAGGNILNHYFNITNTGSKTLQMTLQEKFSGQQVLGSTTVNAGFSGSISGPSGGGYAQTLLLKIEPFFPEMQFHGIFTGSGPCLLNKPDMLPVHTTRTLQMGQPSVGRLALIVRV